MILFQIEENTRVLEKLGQTIGGERSASVATPLGSSGGGHKSGRASVQEKWKMGAKKALLQWCRAQVTHSILVHSFVISWWYGLPKLLYGYRAAQNYVRLHHMLQGGKQWTKNATSFRTIILCNSVHETNWVIWHFCLCNWVNNWTCNIYPPKVQNTSPTSDSFSQTDHGQVRHRGPGFWQELARRQRLPRHREQHQAW